MEGLSKKEIGIVSWLEFHNKYFFSSQDIENFSKNKTQRYNIIKNLLKKGRIVKLNKTKYYLIPIKAKSGSWSEHPFIIVDEMCDGKDYFIGDWAAANYWKLTEQIPIRVGIYTTRRQGKKTILNKKFVFHRTTKKRIKNTVMKEIEGHKFLVQSKENTRKWLKSRS